MNFTACQNDFSGKLRLSQLAFLGIAGVLAGILYFSTSADSITWAHESQDSGELAACASTLGITHPTGYPLYTLAGWLFVHIFFWLEPARVMVLFSVLCGTFTVFFVGLVCFYACRIVYPDEKSTFFAIIASVLTSFFIASNKILWTQSVVCEVYALAILLQSLVWLWIVIFLNESAKGDKSQAGCYFTKIGFIVGLILAHHLSGAYILIPVFIAGLLNSKKITRRSISTGTLMIIPGLLFYLYLPLRSLQNPTLDWGNPENLPNFWAHVTASQYGGVTFAGNWNEIFHRFSEAGRLEVIGRVELILILLGLFVLLNKGKNRGGIALAVGIMLHGIWSIYSALSYRVSDYWVFLYPVLVPCCICLACALGWILTGLKITKWLGASAVVILTLMYIGTSVSNKWHDIDRSNPVLNSAASFAYNCIYSLPDYAVVITGSDGETASLMYAVNCGIENPVTGDKLSPHPEILVVVVHWIDNEWFRQNMKAQYGYEWDGSQNVDGSDRNNALSDFIRAVSVDRPVFITSSVRHEFNLGMHEFKVLDKPGPLWSVEIP